MGISSEELTTGISKDMTQRDLEMYNRGYKACKSRMTMENKMLKIEADKKYLQTDENGNQYYVYFSVETIDKLTRQFVKDNLEEIEYYIKQIKNDNGKYSNCK